MNLVTKWILPLLFLISCFSRLTLGVVCSSSQFHCTGEGEKCIPQSWKCDGDADCPSREDEAEALCPKKPCDLAHQFQCNNGRCIPKHWQCDGDNDCKDNSDEETAACENITCSKDTFRCHQSPSQNCIPSGWRCDGQNDCPKGEDELGCTKTTCAADEFTCVKSGKCLSKDWQCDGDVDCGSTDKSDEENCQGAQTSCHPGYFQCQGQYSNCIPESWKCDGEHDCKDGTDEDPRNCTAPKTCSPREFRCNNGECIHKTWRCDGDTDCPDGSDEGKIGCANRTITCHSQHLACTDQTQSPACFHQDTKCDGKKDCGDGSDEEGCYSKCNATLEFDCRIGSGLNKPMCIPKSNLCDGDAQCENKADENESLCKAYKSKDACSHDKCSGFPCKLDLYAKDYFVCDCPEYLKWDHTTQTCIERNECEESPPVCSQICNDKPKGYTCSCKPGYIMHELHDRKQRYCKAEGGQSYLLFANRHNIKQVGLENKHLKEVVAGTRSAIALDFDFRRQKLYWSDVADEKIKFIKYRPLQDSDKLKSTQYRRNEVVNRVSTPDGIALDWVHQNLYWTDTGLNTIEVVSLETNMRRVLIDNSNPKHPELDEPRSIVVDPRENQGYIYWTDWGKESKIERAGLDGSKRQTIISKHIGWPNGIAIDFVLNRLYWVDGKLHTINSCDLDGGNRRLVYQNREHLKHPFSLSIFEDFVYWSDWELEAILKTNKFNGNNTSTYVVKDLYSPMGVHVYHQLKQPDATNRCMNMGCKGLCLPQPALASAAKCYCSNNDDLLADQKSCRTPTPFVPPSLLPTTSQRTTTSISSTNRTPTHKSLSPKVPHSTTSTPTTKFTRASTPAPTSTAAPTSAKSGVPRRVPDTGRIAGIVIGILLTVVLIAFIIGFFVYRYFAARAQKTMHFDNPVYKKTTEDQFSLERSIYQPSKQRLVMDVHNDRAPLNPHQCEEEA